MTTIRLDRIAVFVRVVEAASFTTAARQLGLPKSSISRRVMYLEKELGVRLLQRTSRKLRLTEAGRTYFDHMRPAIEMIAKTNQVIMKVAEEPQGTVRIAVPPALGCPCS
jgi:DNA-binding transcriptional LysR family regulator